MLPAMKSRTDLQIYPANVMFDTQCCNFNNYKVYSDSFLNLRKNEWERQIFLFFFTHKFRKLSLEWKVLKEPKESAEENFSASNTFDTSGTEVAVTFALRRSWTLELETEKLKASKLWKTFI